MKRVKNLEWLFISFLSGIAIGSAAALLFASRTGKELRNDISSKTINLIEEGKKITSDSLNEVKKKAEGSLEIANDLLNKGMNKITGKAEKVLAA